ncbi:MAG: hypothetical protein ACK55I_30420, partial [bacterium]
MSFPGCGEQDRCPASAGDVLVDRPVVHLVAIGESLGMASGIVGEAHHVLLEPGRAALEDLVGFVTTAEDEVVW